MSHSQEEVELTRDANATLIPHGEEFTLGSGEKVTITHRLGGNFTVMTLQVCIVLPPKMPMPSANR